MLRSKMTSRIAVLGLGLTATVGASAFFAAPAAQASPLPSTCPAYSGDACLFYDGYGEGAVWKMGKGVWEIYDLSGYRFGSTGDGHGQYVINNAASAADPLPPGGSSVMTFYNQHCTGPHDTIPGYTEQNLVQTWNDEAAIINTAAGNYPC